MNGQEFVVEFDFLGKDSIRYYNAVAIEKRVFKNLQLFMENKQDGDDVFDRLNVSCFREFSVFSTRLLLLQICSVCLSCKRCTDDSLLYSYNS